MLTEKINARFPAFLICLFFLLAVPFGSLKADQADFNGANKASFIHISSVPMVEVSETLSGIILDKLTPVLNPSNPLKGEGQVQEGSGSGGNGGGEVKLVDDLNFLGLEYNTIITIFSILAVLLIVVILALVHIKGQMKKMVWQKENPGQTPPAFGLDGFFQWVLKITAPIRHFIFNELNPTLGVLTVIGLVVVVLAFGFYHRAQDLGTQQGYAPDQPVNFSHELHAGKHNIDCQYCHTGVNKAKSANIPSTNICMNCHNIVKEGPKYGSEEIAKVVKAYENNEPIEWVRIHNLPDHVYFNHAQHVNAGNVECETCHGDISNMEVVHQHSKLEMGWCIDCHRNRAVDTSNQYYQEHHEYVKNHDQYTVADMGGTECQKCHY